MILILDYGIGNLLSIERAINKFNKNTKISNKKSDFIEASHLILPGVGSFGFAMKNISEKSLLDPIVKFANSGKAIMGTCLGMQLLLSSSNEFGSNQGLNLIEGKVINISPDTIKDINQEPHYKVTIALNKNSFKQSNETYKLVPGVMVVCGIIIGSRSVFEYIFEPFIAGMQASLIER